jgi:LuxR family maltose regulon positive regulatory protein
MTTAPNSRASLAPGRRVRRKRAELPFAVNDAKIQLPVLRGGLVSRTALVNQLRANTTSPVVAVTAPAGYGKTTLLAQWAARDRRGFAWVSIDEKDRDPIVLLRHIAAALHAVEPLAAPVLEALADPGTSMWTSALPRLGAALTRREQLVVVLDDVHLVRSTDGLEAVSVLADHLSQSGLLVLSGRMTPRLPIAALRAAGKLLEVGIDELALTAKEGQRLLRSTGAELTFEQVTALVRECEGWPAAVYLSALALRDDPAGERGSAPLVARDGSVTTYFRSEYLSRLEAASRRFLRRTSILDQMCGSLCDAVVGEDGSARELEAIERTNLFLVPLDHERSWYRYHRLYRSALRDELAEQEPELVATLHRRAADWYEAHGDLEAALDHVHSAGDHRRAARIFSRVALPVYHSGRAATVRGWLARFEDAQLLARYPTVALHGSLIHALSGRRSTAERWLRIAEDSLARPNAHATAAQRSWVTTIRAALCQDGVYQMIADAESALAGMKRDNPVRPDAVMVLGAGYMLLGQAERADAILAEAASEAERVGATDTQVVAIGERSLIAAAQNDLSAAEQLAVDAHALIEKGNVEGYGTSALALAASARAQLRQGRWEEARADLDKVRRLTSSVGRDLLPWFAVQTRLEFARAYLALRETGVVRSLLAEIRELLRERPHVGVLVDETEALEREVEALPDSQRASAGLTPAELRLLPLLATHLSFREIGAELFVSRNTIKTQAISIYRKLGVTSRSEAIKCAMQLGLIDVAAHPA